MVVYLQDRIRFTRSVLEWKIGLSLDAVCGTGMRQQVIAVRRDFSLA